MEQYARTSGSGPDWRPIGLVALAIAAVWSTAIAAGSWKGVKVQPPKRTIRVTGSAKKRITSDLIQWTATLQADATDRAAAYKVLHDEVDKTVAFLKAQGIPDAEIRPEAVTVEEVWDTVPEVQLAPGTKQPVSVDKKVFKGYSTKQAIDVHSTDVARIERASREVTSLLDQGVAITSEAPSYYYTKLGDLKVEMLAEAGKDARARADNILHSTGGGSIAKLISADMGIININPANSTETSEEGNNDVTSLDKDIITIVHAEFELDGNH